jgi:protein-S-isoprenylcysteine O-methyltransferase Ste14
VNSDKILKTSSVLGYVLMVLALLLMIFFRNLFSASPIVIVVQILAALLMVWARRTFGARSFHFAANPTEGGLVTTGPYRYIRHPIYAAIVYFALAGSVANASPLSISLLVLLFVGVGIRIYCEEILVAKEYPEYAEYSRHTKRVIPFFL